MPHPRGLGSGNPKTKTPRTAGTSTTLMPGEYGKMAQLRAGSLDETSKCVVLAGRQIIHHKDVAWLQSRDETSPHSTKTAVRAFRDRWFRSGDQPGT